MSSLIGSFKCPLCRREYPIEALKTYQSTDDYVTVTFDATHVAQHVEDHARIENEHIQFTGWPRDSILAATA